MVEIVEALDRDFRTFAPELEASTARSIYRIYRDTRFSEDKTPLKTHIAAVFPVRGLDKNNGPGLYLEVSPRGVLVAGGLYAPQPADLLAVRQHLAANHNRFRSIVEAPGFKRYAGGLQGDRLSRVPRGFVAGHPAAEYLRYRQFLVWREFPPGLATTPAFYTAVVRVFTHAAPLVRFLAVPLLARRAPDPLTRIDALR
jgi:uncharacterized protein (TIGR02453 family)